MKVGLLCLAWLTLAAALTLQSDNAERPTTKVVKLLKTMQALLTKGVCCFSRG